MNKKEKKILELLEHEKDPYLQAGGYLLFGVFKACEAALKIKGR